MESFDFPLRPRGFVHSFVCGLRAMPAEPSGYASMLQVSRREWGGRVWLGWAAESSACSLWDLGRVKSRPKLFGLWEKSYLVQRCRWDATTCHSRRPQT